MKLFFFRKKRKAQAFPKPSGVILTHEKRIRKRTFHKKTISFFVIGICFFILSVVAYKFQSFVPHISSDTATLIRPDSVIPGTDVFRKELVRYGIQFESIAYATQSSTLVVKLPRNVYAYLSTTLNPSSQARLLANILSRVAIENKGKILKYIDLTHEKAIVKF